MSIKYILLGILIMAGITYATRVITLVLVRKKIENRYVNSFLYYLPYSVLTAMVFPAILFSTASLFSALAGMAVALVLAYFRRGLLVVSLGAVAAVFLMELLPFI